MFDADYFAIVSSIGHFVAEYFGIVSGTSSSSVTEDATVEVTWVRETGREQTWT